MRCKYCGENIEKEYKYCISCGKPTIDSLLYKNQDKKEAPSIEYFEIETDNKKDENYDFTQFLKGDQEEQEEIDFSTVQDELEEENTEEDNLEDTKKRILFERSDFKIFDNLKKNKERKVIDKNTREEYGTGSNYNRNNHSENSNYKKDNFYSRENVEIDKTKSKLKRKRVGKQIRNVFYNIIVLILIAILSLKISGQVSEFLVNYGIYFFFYLSEYMIILGVFLFIVFLLLPFFICKGNAKIPLLILSTLLSWTIIGWIVLFIVSLTSNNKWQIRMVE